MSGGPSPYDGLPLNTPTLIQDGTDVQLWATRTANGGAVETRPVPGGPTDLANQLAARLAADVTWLRQQAVTARATTVTSGNAVAVLGTVVTQLGTFFDGFADLLQSLGKG